MAIKGAKTIAEYAIRKWMAERFAEEYFDIEFTGNEAVIVDRYGETLKLVYDSTSKRVLVLEWGGENNGKE